MHSADGYAYDMWIVAAFNIGLFPVFILSFLSWVQPPSTRSDSCTAVGASGLPGLSWAMLIIIPRYQFWYLPCSEVQGRGNHDQ